MVLNPKIEELVCDRLDTGRYTTADDVLREALELLRERDRAMEELRASVRLSKEQIARGECSQFNMEEARKGARAYRASLGK